MFFYLIILLFCIIITRKGVFMKHLIVYIKGILLGFVSLAIPGLSASTVALIVNIYYDMINSISDIFKAPKKSIKFLIFFARSYKASTVSGVRLSRSLAPLSHSPKAKQRISVNR